MHEKGFSRKHLLQSTNITGYTEYTLWEYQLRDQNASEVLFCFQWTYV